MKIAILTPTFSGFSGIDRVVYMQAQDLSKDHDVTIFAFKGTLKPPKRVRLVTLGCPTDPTIERFYRLFMFLDFPKINSAARLLEEFDEIISHMYPMNLIAIKSGKKWAFHNHGVAYPELFSTVERIYLELFNYFSNQSIRKATERIAISKFIAGELKRETGLTSKILPDRVDKRFRKGLNGAKIKKKHKIGKEPVLLYVGRISPHKGVDLLIRAFNLLLERVPNTKLMIVGKRTFGAYGQLLDDLAKKNVIFAGFVPDEELPYYYAACDVYTTCSRWEGFDLPVVEAQTCGRPVIAFDCCSHPEVVKKGFLVEDGNINKFAKAVESVLRRS